MWGVLQVLSFLIGQWQPTCRIVIASPKLCCSGWSLTCCLQYHKLCILLPKENIRLFEPNSWLLEKFHPKIFTELKSPLVQQSSIAFLSLSISGTSQTLKTASLLISPKPTDVAWRLLIACLISPSAVKIIASRPSSWYLILKGKNFSYNNFYYIFFFDDFE